jgi:hypothetical protein
VAILNEGEIRASGTVEELTREHGSSLEQAFLKIIGYSTAVA